MDYKYLLLKDRKETYEAQICILTDQLKIYIFESHDDYMWPQGFSIAHDENEAWQIFKENGKVKEIGLNDTDKKYYSIKTIPLERTGYSFECEN